ncbi:MAG: hypothetical protein JKY54_13695, partial [Flavobacteriales bacterium]|nr:hypothetical protein [Flavobacteriales bacterium]
MSGNTTNWENASDTRTFIAENMNQSNHKPQSVVKEKLDTINELSQTTEDLTYSLEGEETVAPEQYESVYSANNTPVDNGGGDDESENTDDAVGTGKVPTNETASVNGSSSEDDSGDDELSNIDVKEGMVLYFIHTGGNTAVEYGVKDDSQTVQYYPKATWEKMQENIHAKESQRYQKRGHSVKSYAWQFIFYTYSNAEVVVQKEEPTVVDESSNNPEQDKQAKEEKSSVEGGKEEINTAEDWDYLEDEGFTNQEWTERNWVATFDDNADPNYGKDLSLFNPLTEEQKVYYNWDVILEKWKEENKDPDIGPRTIEQWLSKHLMLGWTEKDPIPNINEVKYTYNENGEPIIQAATYSDAFSQATKLGLRRNVYDVFIWETKIMGTRERHAHNFAPPEVYYNRTHLDLEFKLEYIEEMALVLGLEDVQEVKDESDYGSDFANLVRRAQMDLSLENSGKFTPETITAVHNKAEEIRKEEVEKTKQEKARIEAAKKEKKRRLAKNKSPWSTGRTDSKDKKNTYYTYEYYDFSESEEGEKTTFVRKVGREFAALRKEIRNNGDMDDEICDLDGKWRQLEMLEFWERTRCLRVVANGTYVGATEEKALVALVKWTPPHQREKMKNWLLKSKNFTYLWNAVERQNDRIELGNILANDYNLERKGSLEEARAAVNEGLWSSDTLMGELADHQIRKLESLDFEMGYLDEKKYPALAPFVNSLLRSGKFRLRAIELIANDYSVGSDDEKLLQRLISLLPKDEATAKVVRRDIAKILIKKKDGRPLWFTLYNSLHDHYEDFKDSLETIYRENGDIFARQIEKKLKNNSVDKIHIEYYARMADREVFKHLSTDDKLLLIKKIVAGDHERGYDEEAILEILESVGLLKLQKHEQLLRSAKNASGEELTKLEEKAKTLMAEAQEERLKFAIKLEKGTQGVSYNSLQWSLDGINDTKLRKLFNDMRYGQDEKFINEVVAKKDDDELRDAGRYFSDKQLASLSIADRKEFIKKMALIGSSGWDQFWEWTGDPEELAIAKAIALTPHGQAEELGRWLFEKTDYYDTIHSAVDGEENKTLHDAFKTLMETIREEQAFSSEDMDQLKILSLKEYDNNADSESINQQFTDYEKIQELINKKQQGEAENEQEIRDLMFNLDEGEKVFPWNPDGMSQAEGYSFRYDVKLVDWTVNGKPVVKLKVVPIRSERKNDGKNSYIVEKREAPVYLDPLEPIGIYLDEDSGGLGEGGQVITMPAINMMYLEDKQTHEDIMDGVMTLVDIVALILSIIPLLGAGLKGLALAIRIADAAIAAMAIFVHQNEKLLGNEFVEIFNYVEVMTVGFDLLLSPKSIGKVMDQVDKLDSMIRILKIAGKMSAKEADAF